MKRHEQLKTLSWEHHDGLVTASRVRRGLINQTNPAEIVRFIMHVWQEDLTHHFAQEEETLLPALQKKQDCSELIEKVLDHHRRLRMLVETLPRNDINKRIQVKKFCQLLDEHIRFEEREFFPCAETQLSDEQLQKIGLYLREQHRPACKTWQPAFWETTDNPKSKQTLTH